MWIADQVGGLRGARLLAAAKSWSAGGGYILVRPDPQAIWETPHSDPRWRNAQTGATTARHTGGGQLGQATRCPSSWQMRYRDLTFHVQAHELQAHGRLPRAGGELGLMRMAKIRAAGRPVSVLNLFAYTGAATRRLRARRARASATWTPPRAWSPGRKENAARLRSGRRADPLDRGRLREVRRARDPPRPAATTPSSWTRRATAAARAARSGSWRTNLYPFVKLGSRRAVSDDPLFVIINSYTTGLAPSVLDVSARTVCSSRRLRRQGAVATSWACLSPSIRARAALRRDRPLGSE